MEVEQLALLLQQQDLQQIKIGKARIFWMVL
jgi:hypothetical protein